METETFIRIAIFLGGAMFGCLVGVFMICLFMGATCTGTGGNHEAHQQLICKKD